MLRRKILFSLCSLTAFTSVHADTSPQKSMKNPDPNHAIIKSPQQIQEEINTAQQDFEVTQRMFIPWYTGPLITGSANNVPMGHVNLQPYLYMTVNHAEYDDHRHSHNIKNEYVINPLLVFQLGLTHWLDFNIFPQGFFKWQGDHSGQSFGDLPVQFGLQLLRETPYLPNIRFIIGENFPTGSYRNLNSHKDGLDGSGAGIFATTVGLNLSKVFWWLKLHPVAVRLATLYTMSDNKASVKGFNTYGGGYGTHGKVAVGNSFSADLGIEVSLTERWVLATDVAYNYSWKSTFTGNHGITAEGLPATVGAPLADQLSLAPAIEYNVSDTAGFIGGVWFSVTGRNSANFASLVLSYTVLF